MDYPDFAPIYTKTTLFIECQNKSTYNMVNDIVNENITNNKLLNIFKNNINFRFCPDFNKVIYEELTLSQIMATFNIDATCNNIRKMIEDSKCLYEINQAYYEINDINAYKKYEGSIDVFNKL